MKKNKELIPAPLNQKDIMADALFDQLFDYLPGYVEDNKAVLGFIDGHPVALLWKFNSNEIRIWPIREIDNIDEAKRSIIKVLEKLNVDTAAQTFCEIKDLLLSVSARFYYRPEE